MFDDEITYGSGNKPHMLALHDIEGIPMVTPHDALSRLEAEGYNLIASREVRRSRQNR